MGVEFFDLFLLSFLQVDVLSYVCCRPNWSDCEACLEFLELGKPINTCGLQFTSSVVEKVKKIVVPSCVLGSMSFDKGLRDSLCTAKLLLASYPFLNLSQLQRKRASAGEARIFRQQILCLAFLRFKSKHAFAVAFLSLSTL